MKKILFLSTILSFSSLANAQSFDLRSVLTQELSGSQVYEYEQAFDELDSNNDGVLSEQELLKFQQNGLSNNEENIHDILDDNRDGYISEKEYLGFYKRQSLQNISESELTQNFRNMDANNDGLISTDELQNYRLNNLESQNRQIFEIMDTNGDGKLEKDEFSGFMSFAGNVLSN